ncbi:MAG: sigma-54-dependent Fis family transcriptional regulator [Rubrivivax sp.]|nr:sigma-54-dependent Fis family transcriptional regulator [Rubrivivax sp.]
MIKHTAGTSLAHAQALRARGSAWPPDEVPQPEVLDSWVRCMQWGLDASQRITPPVVEALDLQSRREQWADVRRLARVELETLSRQIAGSNFLLAFADREGVILDLYHDNRFAMNEEGAGIVTGSCWSESIAGTNGLGTALAQGGSVAVTGLEHYFFQLGSISCTATPVHDAAGEIVGVLDASSYVQSRQRHTQALVQMAAAHIENRLLVQQLKAHWVLALHPRAEYLGTLSAGLLAFGDDGRLLAANPRARQMLQGLRAQAGAAFEELFAEPFELAAARLARQDDVRLRDLLGSTLVALCISRPLPRAPSARAGSTGPRRAAEPSPAAFRLSQRRPDLAAIGSDAHGDADGDAPVQQRRLIAEVRQDPVVAATYALASRAARLRVPMLLQGETGAGKELLARHIHASSGRRGAFVAVNCGAMPAELFEAELFGHVAGAFTGAGREGSAGLIASADGGTLLLDEIRELPLGLQAGLLRFLDDQLLRPVGGTQQRRVDVQLLAATHADLAAEVEAHRFRADLMYRLNTVHLTLPPLRERQDFADCVRTVLHALEPGAGIDEAALQRLAHHPWPGNFRELRAILTRALLAPHGPTIGAAEVEALLPVAMGPQAATQANGGLRRKASELVRLELQRHGGSISETARALGISRTTVYRHLRDGAGSAVKAP